MWKGSASWIFPALWYTLSSYFPPPSLSSICICIYIYTCSRVLWSNCPSETKVNPPHRQRLEKTLAKTAVADFSLAAAFFRRTVGSFSQELVFFFFPGRGTGCLALAGRGREYHISPGGPASGCGLCRVKTFQMAFVQLSPGAQMLPAPRLSALRPALHTCGPPASHPRALGEGIRVLYKWPAWEGFPYGIGFNSVWLLFPFKPDSDWDSFLSGGSQLPRCCHFLFYISVEEYFSFIFKIFFFFFFATKRTHVSSVSPLDRDLTSVDSSVLCVVGPSSSTISNTVMHITQHCDLI